MHHMDEVLDRALLKDPVEGELPYLSADVSNLSALVQEGYPEEGAHQ